jgi:hypothetical protein
MYLKPTIQKVTNFDHFANPGREQMFGLSNWHCKKKILTIILSIFFIRSFYLK